MGQRVPGWWIIPLLVTATSVGPAAAVDTQWITFYPAGPGIDAADGAAEAAVTAGSDARQATHLWGFLATPEGAGPFPAVVLLHDCRGVRPHQMEWARRLARWGYIALLTNSFLSRNVVRGCAAVRAPASGTGLDPRVYDAYGALAYLATLPAVDPERIALIGWADRATLDTLRPGAHPTELTPRFRAAVAITPNCANARGDFAVPLLVLVAGADDWAPSDACLAVAELADTQPPSVEIKRYAHAHHAFDDPELEYGVGLTSFYNPLDAGKASATLRYDQAAHEDAVGRIEAFLALHLLSGSGGDGRYRTVAKQPARPRGTWVVDPNEPGENAPPVGRSLFDRLFAVDRPGGSGYEIPFPFRRLLERIDRHLPRDPFGGSSLKKVLIPLGRSLQRVAADPDYFKHPRVVVAVDSEPASADGTDLAILQSPLPLGKRGRATEQSTPIFMKDRLFLGYQEKAQVLEVISYNETAARFEFQIVANYGPGLTPRVEYAPRALCTSCHQNGSPIFAKAAWDETNGNRQISARLQQEGPTYQDVSANLAGRLAASIDNATDRANLFSAYQLLWREGCGGDAGEEAVGCRAAALTAMLQFRLSAQSHFDRRSTTYAQRHLRILARNWKRLWPDGLHIPNPNITNREPLLSPTPVAIPAELDPLNPRPPLTTWSAEKEKDLEQLVIGLSEFLPTADVRRLDAHLFQQGLKQPRRRTRFPMICRIAHKATLRHARLLGVNCLSAGAIDLQVELLLEPEKIAGGAVNWLEMGDGSRFIDLRVAGTVASNAAGTTLVRLRPSHGQSALYVRLPDGSAIESIELRWPSTKRSGRDLPGGQPTAGTATLTVMADFTPVYAAITALAEKAVAGTLDLFRQTPFSGTRAMQLLLAELGLEPTRWCCDEPVAMPALRVASASEVGFPEFIRTHDERGKLGSFFRHCGACHQRDARMPPGFLRGDESRVRANLRHCAERIYYRLRMWDIDPEQRRKSPMPPAHSLASRHTAASTPPVSLELGDLRRYARGLLEDERGDASYPERLLVREYESTRSCLPE